MRFFTVNREYLIIEFLELSSSTFYFDLQAQEGDKNVKFTR